VQVLDRSDNFVHVVTDKARMDRRRKFPAVRENRAGREVNCRARQAKAVGLRRPKHRLGSRRRASGSSSTTGNYSGAQTPVHLKLGRELSSQPRTVGDEVNFEVSQDVIVGGITVIAKGAPGFGAVTEAEPKKRMGKTGKLDVAVNSVLLANREKIILRSFGIEQSAVQKSGRTIPLLRGKDVTLAKDTEIIVMSTAIYT